MAFINLVPGGLDNKHDPARLGKIADNRDPTIRNLVEAVNVDIDDNGVATRRLGRSRVYTGVVHSFWVTPDHSRAFFVEGGVLKELNADYTAVSLITLNDDVSVCYEDVGGTIVFSDGIALGSIVGGEASWFTAPDTTFPNEFKSLMPGGQYIAFYDGILYVARGSLLYMSIGYNLGVMDTRRNIIPLIGYIRMLAAVEDGLWAAMDNDVSFVKGRDPDEMTFTFISDEAPADGCFSVIYDYATGLRKVIWASRDGFCVGTAGGKYVNLSENKVALPSGSSGACWLREQNGQEHYIAVITDPTGGNTYLPESISIDTKYV